MKSVSCSVTTTTCLFLCLILSLSMLCVSLWLTSEGLTNYVELMESKLKEEDQIRKKKSLSGSSDVLVQAVHARPTGSSEQGSEMRAEGASSDSRHEVRKHRTRLLTRTKCLQSFFSRCSCVELRWGLQKPLGNSAYVGNRQRFAPEMENCLSHRRRKQRRSIRPHHARSTNIWRHYSRRLFRNIR